MDVDLSAYVAAGYVVTKPVPRESNRSPELLSDTLISLAPCIAAAVELSWGWDDSGRQRALAFGVPSNKLGALSEWNPRDDEVGHNGIFYTIEAARRFIAEFLPGIDEIALLGIGLGVGMVDAFLVRHAQRASNQYGLYRFLAARRALEPGGEVLGFEVASCFPGSQVGHSWLCNMIQDDVAREFGIRPGPYGLLTTEADARRVHAWIAEDEERGTRAEPEPYYPWLLMRYPTA